MKKTKRKDTLKVFRLLGLETERDRQRVRKLAELGHGPAREVQATFPCADTRNNTRREDNDAQLESAS